GAMPDAHRAQGATAEPAPLPPMGEAGQTLSGGQRQRIALARALYGLPAVVVLDEPNAHLDDVGEAALQNALQTLRSRGRTVIVISHRPGVLAVADQVVLMRDGRIVQQGPRDAVLRPQPHSSTLPPSVTPAHEPH
ncbi:ATP-binding cassette domain-containing protein, partial [Tepidimonas sp.]|uniref:ATP-binding cassette domain-containing protein n=1 Tax=Tepidimonas sp. TaxID=2002775 RepID=UPI00391DAEC3